MAEHISVEDYLELERVSEDKFERLDGRLYLFPGHSLRENCIMGNLWRLLHDIAEARGCLASPMRVRVDDHFLRPTLNVTCATVDDRDEWVTAPRVVFQVLTERNFHDFHNHRKPILFNHTPRIEQIVVLYDDEQKAEIYSRLEGNTFRVDWLEQGSIPIPSLETTLSFEQIYDHIELYGPPSRRQS